MKSITQAEIETWIEFTMKNRQAIQLLVKRCLQIEQNLLTVEAQLRDATSPGLFDGEDGPGDVAPVG